MLELYQSEACTDCAAVRRRLAAMGVAFVVRTVPIERDRRVRTVEAGGRADIPLLLDPDRGRTTYDADEILLQLGTKDLFGVDESSAEALPRLYQREGEAPSGRARRLLDDAGLDYVCRSVSAATPDIPCLVPTEGPRRCVGLEAIEAWLRERQEPAAG